MKRAKAKAKAGGVAEPIGLQSVVSDEYAVYVCFDA